MEKVLNMKLQAKLYDDLKQKSEERNVSMAALVRMILTEWINKN